MKVSSLHIHHRSPPPHYKIEEAQPRQHQQGTEQPATAEDGSQGAEHQGREAHRKGVGQLGTDVIDVVTVGGEAGEDGCVRNG